jgi:hypothetical protein
MSTFPKRKGEPDTQYTYNDAIAGVVVLTSNDAGLVTIADETEERVAVAFGLEPAKPEPKPAPTPKEV